ncbi:hypothetical protein AbraIFM66950_003887 [Aspergillus brasiliensis]|nr:hypothetical protein AbraIFM66950_003887 [Aspergillus brasiliensis]
MINTLLLVAPLVSAAPTGTPEVEKTNKDPERSLQYILNCSTEAYTYFCGHHGTTCWGAEVMGSPVCRDACECHALNVCTECGTPYSGGHNEQHGAVEGDDGNDVVSTSSAASDATTSGSSVPSV